MLTRAHSLALYPQTPTTPPSLSYRILLAAAGSTGIPPSAAAAVSPNGAAANPWVQAPFPGQASPLDSPFFAPVDTAAGQVTLFLPNVVDAPLPGGSAPPPPPPPAPPAGTASPTASAAPTPALPVASPATSGTALPSPGLDSSPAPTADAGAVGVSGAHPLACSALALALLPLTAFLL
jgi:hypothetical protein